MITFSRVRLRDAMVPVMEREAVCSGSGGLGAKGGNNYGAGSKKKPIPDDKWPSHDGKSASLPPTSEKVSNDLVHWRRARAALGRRVSLGPLWLSRGIERHLVT